MKSSIKLIGIDTLWKIFAFSNDDVLKLQIIIYKLESNRYLFLIFINDPYK